MAFATISADIVASSSLSNEAKIGLNESLKKCIGTLESHYGGFWGRIVRGDSVECIVEKPEDALEIALILKTWVKAYGPNVNSAANEFKKYGIRLAIGIGDMSIIDKSRDIMDGDAIYRSGRSLDGLSGWSKYSMVISMALADSIRNLGSLAKAVANVTVTVTDYHQSSEAGNTTTLNRLGYAVEGDQLFLEIQGSGIKILCHFVYSLNISKKF